MKTVLIILIIIHGLIHLLGYSKKNKRPGRAAYARPFWMVVTALFLVTAWLIISGIQTWWLLAWMTIILSQVLIIINWKEAKAGTILNILILLFSITAFGEWRFNGKVSNEINSMILSPKPTPTILTTEMTKALPYPVRNWLHSSGAVGKEITYRVYLEQKGRMRTEPGGDWMPTEAEQYFTIPRPAFIWKASVNMNPVVWLSGRDKYEDGKGNMLIKAYSMIPVVDGKGEKIDQGTMLRFLGEMCWFPCGAVSPYLEWQPVDSSSARVTMSYKGTSVGGIYHFDEQGRVKGFTAKRYMADGALATVENWQVITTKWKNMNGVTIPVEGDVAWELSSGRFSYYQWEITSIKYNQ